MSSLLRMCDTYGHRACSSQLNTKLRVYEKLANEWKNAPLLPPCIDNLTKSWNINSISARAYVHARDGQYETYLLYLAI